MASKSVHQLTFDGPGRYRVCIKGYLDESRLEWLGGLQISTQGKSGPSTVTTLVGQLADQAALVGVLNAIYEMHLPLLSAEYLGGDD
jgi:hypothetical protein